MIGQGSPTAQASWLVRWTRMVLVSVCASLAFACEAPAQTQPAPQPVTETYRLRIEWGGPRRVHWSGSISVDRGQFHDLTLLGMEADAPGSIYLEQGQVQVSPRSGRRYDGIEINVTAPADATVTFRIAPNSEPTQPPNQPPPDAKSFTVPLAKLVQQSVSETLDEQGNQLVARRAPGDLLRVAFDRDHLIFHPGEHFVFRISPRTLGLAEGAQVQLRAQLTSACDKEPLWSEAYPIQAPTSGASGEELAIDVPLPEKEGAYDLVLSTGKRKWLTDPFQRGKQDITRTIQLLVLDPKTAPAPLQSGTPWTEVLEIDPANPRWWQRLPGWSRLERLPGMPKGPLGSGHSSLWRHPLQKIVRLDSRPDSTEPSWQAYPLPIKNPGVPHLLEIEYPSDTEQHLGISILEPNAAGMVWPITQDSGVYHKGMVRGETLRMLRHRIIFWPKTSTPLVLITNKNREQPAGYGQIRVSIGPSRLPRALALDRVSDQRQIAARMARPLFNEQFGASDSLDLESTQSVDDWQTFYEGATRLVDYLNHVGYNGLMVSVFADGSTIYPSRLLEPTPLYDGGTLATTGQDPVRKDALELLLRLTDREGLRVTPSLRFASTVPAIESLRRRGPAWKTGIEWVGPDGRTWNETHAARRKQAPYYNLLNEEVQRAMLDIVDELLERYADHPSFQGLAIPLSGYSFAQLPDPQWGFDDHTIAQFQRDTQIAVPGAGADRFAQRAAFLRSPAQLNTWLAWRASRVERFYYQVTQRIQSARPDAKLILPTAEMFDSPTLNRHLKPSLSRRTLDQLMLEAGIRPQAYSKSEHIVLLRPRIATSPESFAHRTEAVELDNLVNHDQTLLRAARGASDLFHPPQRQRLPSFDQVSPFGRDNTFVKLVAQPTPSDAMNRQQLVHELATSDTNLVFDGGYLIPMGQEDAVRKLFDHYRQLPSSPQVGAPLESQPVTVRTLARTNETWIYLVNDSPWSVETELELDIPNSCTLTRVGANERPRMLVHPSASREKPTPKSTWAASMQPFELIVIRCSIPKVTVRDVRVEVSRDAIAQLETQIQNLDSRAVALIQQPALNLLTNPGFESESKDGSIEGWELVRASADPTSENLSGPNSEGIEATLDTTVFHNTTQGLKRGRQSLRLSSEGPVATVRSAPFRPPTTGRMVVSAWIYVDAPSTSPQLQVRVEGPHGYFKYAAIGGDAPYPFKEGWQEILFQVDNMAEQDLSQVRLRFDLMGAGAVWIDDIQLRKFLEEERKELSRIIFSTSSAFAKGQYGDCLRLLDSYWPQYLLENTAPTAQPIARNARAASRKKAAPNNQDDPGVLDKVKGYVPKFMRF